MKRRRQIVPVGAVADTVKAIIVQVPTPSQKAYLREKGYPNPTSPAYKGTEKGRGTPRKREG